MEATNLRLTPCRVLHIENDPLWRNIIAKILHTLEEANDPGGASEAELGSQNAAPSGRKIIIVEPTALECNLLEFIDEQTAQKRHVTLVFLTHRVDELVLSQLRHSFVSGLIWKPLCDMKSLAETMRAAARGDRWLNRDIQIAWTNLRSQPEVYFKILSERELRLLPKFAHAESDLEIARATGIAESTVRSHRENIMRKLGINRTGKLVNWATARGFVTAQSSEYLTTLATRRMPPDLVTTLAH